MQLYEFDFSEASAGLRRYLDPNHPDYAPDDRHAARFWLTLPQFPEFAATFFAQDAHWQDVITEFHAGAHTAEETAQDIASDGADFPQDMNSALSLATCIHTDSVRPFLPTAVPDKPVRKVGITAFTKDELVSSLPLLDEHPYLVVATMALQSCLQRYLNKMNEVMTRTLLEAEQNSSKHGQARIYLKSGLSALSENAASATVLTELLPILCISLQDKQSPFSGKDLHKAFHECFPRSAFRSVSPAGAYNECPFRTALLNIYGIGFNENDDGSLTALPDQAPGTFILWARDKIERDYADLMQAPDSGPPLSITIYA